MSPLNVSKSTLHSSLSSRWCRSPKNLFEGNIEGSSNSTIKSTSLIAVPWPLLNDPNRSNLFTLNSRHAGTATSLIFSNVTVSNLRTSMIMRLPERYANRGELSPTFHAYRLEIRSEACVVVLAADYPAGWLSTLKASVSFCRWTSEATPGGRLSIEVRDPQRRSYWFVTVSVRDARWPRIALKR